MIYIALLFVVCFYLHIATRGEQRLVICKKKSYKRASGFFVSLSIKLIPFTISNNHPRFSSL